MASTTLTFALCLSQISCPMFFGITKYRPITWKKRTSYCKLYVVLNPGSLTNPGYTPSRKQYIPRNMHTAFALLCFVVVIHWLIFPYPSGLLHWHCGNLTIAPVPAKQPWWIWINTLCEFIMNDCITTRKQSTTKLCTYFLGYTVPQWALNATEQNYETVFTLYHNNIPEISLKIQQSETTHTNECHHQYQHQFSSFVNGT